MPAALRDNPFLDKYLFVVDRKDLDRQTHEELGKFDGLTGSFLAIGTMPLNQCCECGGRKKLTEATNYHGQY